MAAVTICSDFGAPKIKSLTVSTVSPSISHEVMDDPAGQWMGLWEHRDAQVTPHDDIIYFRVASSLKEWLHAGTLLPWSMGSFRERFAGTGCV